jgi:sulfur-oxidizing protein SoxX
MSTPEAAGGRFPLKGATLADRQSRIRGVCLIALFSVFPVLALQVEGDGIPQPLSATPGDAVRGRALVASRQQGLCLLCHQAPIPEERFQGNLATNLVGAGSRWSPAQLRLRLVDSRRLNPDSIMPAFHRTDGLHNVGKAWAGKPVFDAQQVEDVVAYLSSLKD